jgi:hypothetical protein
MNHDSTTISAEDSVRPTLNKLLILLARPRIFARPHGVSYRHIRPFCPETRGSSPQGTHRFCHTPTSCESAAPFTMVWREKDGQWQVTRVMSYDHREERVAAKGR